MLQSGLLEKDQLERVRRLADERKETVEEVVRAEQLIFPEQLARLKARYLDVPYADLEKTGVDARAMSDISRRAAIAYQFVAFGQEDGKLRVAMAHPEDQQALEAVRFIAEKRSLTPEIYCASAEKVEESLKTSPRDDLRQALREFGREVRRAESAPQDKEKLRRALAKAPVDKVVAVIMRMAIEGGASDIHVEPYGRQFRVRYRIDHHLSTTLLLPLNLLPAVIDRLKVLANVRVSGHDLPQQGRFVLPVEEQSYSVHCSFMPTVFGERAALRLIDTARPAPSFKELGWGGFQVQLLNKVLAARDGLIMVSGPPGSGKSTTLFALLFALNRPDKNIATLESRVEYEMAGVNQTQLRPAQGLTGGVALQGVLRQDADVVMIDELAERDTSLAAVKAAAGCLILSAVEAADAASVFSYLAGLDLNPALLASRLRLIIAQRLVPKLCQSCRRPSPVPRELRSEIQAGLRGIPGEVRDEYGLGKRISLFTSEGCPDCREGRTDSYMGLFEVVPLFRELRAAITAREDKERLEKIIRRGGYLSLRQDGLIKALTGLVDYRDVISALS